MMTETTPQDRAVPLEMGEDSLHNTRHPFHHQKTPTNTIVSVDEIQEVNENAVTITLEQHGAIVPLPNYSFWDLLEHALSTFGECTAAIDSSSGETISYDDLCYRSERLGHVLRQYSSKPVGLCVEPSIDLLVAFVTLARQGMTYVAIDPSYPEDRARYVIKDSGIDAVVCSSHLSALPQFSDIEPVHIDVLSHHRSSHDHIISAQRTPEQAMAVVYTSGSSGTPKGVILSYRAVLNRLLWQMRENPLVATDVVAAKTKIGFGDSIAETWAPFFSGVPIVYISASIILNPSLFLDALESFQISFLIVVPALLKVLLCTVEDRYQAQLKSLRQVISSGDVLPYETCELFFHRLPHCCLANYYGATETTADITGVVYHNIDEVKRHAYKRNVSVGRVIDNTSIFIHDADANGVGELIVTGKGLASGYISIQGTNGFSKTSSFACYHDIDDNRFCFRTGDRGKFHNNHLILLGRTDRQVKIAGNRINLNEIEHAIDRCMKLKTPPVALMLEDQIIAFFEEHESPDWAAARHLLRKWLPEYAMPRFVSIPKIPLLAASGKIDRQALLKEMHLAVSSDPQVHIQQGVADMPYLLQYCFTLLLRSFENAGLHQRHHDQMLNMNFFEIGGTSLNALMVLSKTQQQGFQLSLEQFLLAPTIRDIVVAMSSESLQHRARDTHRISASHNRILSRSRWDLVQIDATNLEEAVVLLGTNFVHEQLTMFRTDNFGANKRRLQDEATFIFRAQLSYFVHHCPEMHVSFGLCDEFRKLVAVSFAYADDFSNIAKGSVFAKSSLSGKLSLPTAKTLAIKDGVFTKTIPGIDKAIHAKGQLLRLDALTAKGTLRGQAKVAAFLDKIQGEVVSQLRSNGYNNILCGLANAVDHQTLPDPAMRVQAMMVMESELLERATIRGFDTIFSINTSPLTQDAADLLGYETARTIGDLGVVKDSTGKPAFPGATANAVVKVQYKTLKQAAGG